MVSPPRFSFAMKGEVLTSKPQKKKKNVSIGKQHPCANSLAQYQTKKLLTHLVKRRRNRVRDALDRVEQPDSLAKGHKPREGGSVGNGRNADHAVDLAGSVQVFHPVPSQDAALRMTLIWKEKSCRHFEMCQFLRHKHIFF